MRSGCVRLLSQEAYIYQIHTGICFDHSLCFMPKIKESNNVKINKYLHTGISKIIKEHHTSSQVASRTEIFSNHTGVRLGRQTIYRVRAMYSSFGWSRTNRDIYLNFCLSPKRVFRFQVHIPGTRYSSKGSCTRRFESHVITGQ